MDYLAILLILTSIFFVAAALKFLFFSDHSAKEAQNAQIREDLPDELKEMTLKASYLGWERNLDMSIFLPYSVRSRHLHIIGATGSGKTESVLLNLIDQDVIRGFPLVIVDAKGDKTFLDFLNNHPDAKDRLKVFDSSSQKSSLPYNPLRAGTPTEAALRLFNCMTWSEEFYKTRARDVLLKLAAHCQSKSMRLTLAWLNEVLSSPESLSRILDCETNPLKVSTAEYSQLAGLVSQVAQLCHGELGALISGLNPNDEIVLSQIIQNEQLLYFKLPSLIDPVTTSTVGKLIVADLALYSAQVQSGEYKHKFCPVFLDEFGSLACHSFLELISKARSAGLALHFSHQSLGDLEAAGPTFATQINDNSSTKIVMRVYDPDTADTMARTFGNLETAKETRQVVVKALTGKEDTGALSVRDVKEFRADPDLIKSLPTGSALVLMNHALRPDGRSSDVFYLRFKPLRKHKKKGN